MFDANANRRWRARGSVARAYRPSDPSVIEDEEHAQSALFQIYFNDPFLAYAYIASISFFVALYQAFKVLGYARQTQVFSQASIKAVRIIRFCAIAIIAFVAGGEVIIMLGNSDDRAGGVFMGILIAFGSLVVVAAAALVEHILRDAMK